MCKDLILGFPEIASFIVQGRISPELDPDGQLGLKMISIMSHLSSRQLQGSFGPIRELCFSEKVHPGDRFGDSEFETTPKSLANVAIVLVGRF